MTRLIVVIARMIITFQSICTSDLQNKLKKKIRNTYLRVFLQKFINKGGGIIDVVGYRFKYCRRDTLACLFNEIFINHDYCFFTENSSPFIIDCGSNIGMSVLYFKVMYPDSSIIAFEPDEDAYACLKHNVTENELKNVDIYKKAVSMTDGEIEFYYDDENPGSLFMSSIQDRLPKQKRVVEATRLSTFIDKDVELLKIDVEGAEFAVIEELIQSGKISYIKQIIMEYHHHISEEEDVFSKMLHKLENAGFGYQISSELGRPLKRREFQDILVYAYHKG